MIANVVTLCYLFLPMLKTSSCSFDESLDKRSGRDLLCSFLSTVFTHGHAHSFSSLHFIVALLHTKRTSLSTYTHPRSNNMKYVCTRTNLIVWVLWAILPLMRSNSKPSPHQSNKSTSNSSMTTKKTPLSRSPNLIIQPADHLNAPWEKPQIDAQHQINCRLNQVSCSSEINYVNSTGLNHEHHTKLSPTHSLTKEFRWKLMSHHSQPTKHYSQCLKTQLKELIVFWISPTIYSSTIMNPNSKNDVKNKKYVCTWHLLFLSMVIIMVVLIW